MEKFLITLIVPALGQRYDVLLPKFLTIEEVLPLLTEAVCDVSQHQYVSSGKEILCSGDPYRILELDDTVGECGIQNGDKIYLF